MSTWQRDRWEHQIDDPEDLVPIREEWEYQDDDDDGCREIAYTPGDYAHQQVWLGEERDQSDLAYISAAKAYERTQEDITELRRLPYEQYLRTPHWITTRRRAMLRAGRRCQRCESGYRLEVHHLTYLRRGCEAEGDLLVLCAACHEAEHANPDNAEPEGFRDFARYAHVLSESFGGALRQDYAGMRDCQNCGMLVVGRNRACSRCGRAP
jgi:hypothetical protein